MRSTSDLSSISPRNLAQLFSAINNAAANPATTWRESDFGAIFEHLLDSPLLLAEQIDADVDHSPMSDDRAVASLRDVLITQSPDPVALDLIKCYAKREYQLAERSIPEPVALVLYFLSIARALDTTRITELSDKDLSDGIRWSLRQTWVEVSVREVLERAQRHLSGAV